jgi:hypothetical protein
MGVWSLEFGVLEFGEDPSGASTPNPKSIKG